MRVLITTTFIFLVVSFLNCGNYKKQVIFLSSSYQDSSSYDETLFDSIYRSGNALTGKKIKLSGYLSMRFEDFAVYESLSDAKNYNYSRAIWFKTDPYEQNNMDVLSEYNKLNKIFFIEVDGILDINRKGHMNQYLGEILVKKAVLK